MAEEYFKVTEGVEVRYQGSEAIAVRVGGGNMKRLAAEAHTPVLGNGNARLLPTNVELRPRLAPSVTTPGAQPDPATSSASVCLPASTTRRRRTDDPPGTIGRALPAPPVTGSVNGQLDLPVDGQHFSLPADTRTPGVRTADVQVKQRRDRL